MSNNQPLRPTLADVASRAHVSTGTASKALRGIGQLDQSTRDRVKAAAKELGYRTDISARALRTGIRTRMVGLVFAALPTTHDPRDPDSAWERMIYAVTHELFRSNVSIILTPTIDHLDVDSLPIDALILVTLNPNDVDHFAAQQLDVPLVVAGIDLDEAARNALPVDGWIIPEVETLVFTAFDHLASQGAQKPAFISTPQPLAQIEAMEQAAQRWGSEHACPTIVIPSSEPHEAVTAALAEGADAILFRGDESIADLDVAIEAINDAGMAIPDDVLLMAVSGGGRENHYQRDVTTVGWDGSNIGTVSGKLVSDGLNSGKFGTITLQHTLSPRASTARK